MLVTTECPYHTVTMGVRRENRHLGFDRPVVDQRPCDSPGCAAPGAFRAPRARDTLTTYYWFCQDHVRSYNAAWDYYAGMTESDIEVQLRADTTWRRPTWPLGTRAAMGARRALFGLRDDFGFLYRSSRRNEERRRADDARLDAKAKESHQAMSIMDLSPPANEVAIKARYRELVKRHHPDANGGDKAAEERLKLITQAYRTLRKAIGF